MHPELGRDGLHLAGPVQPRAQRRLQAPALDLGQLGERREARLRELARERRVGGEQQLGEVLVGDHQAAALRGVGPR